MLKSFMNFTINYKYNQSMKQKHGLSKINQIICLSNDYINHKKNLKKVKGVINNTCSKRNIDISDYLYRKNSYRQVRNQLKQRQITKQNEKIVQRLSDISDRKNQTRRSLRSNQSMRSNSSQVSSRMNFLKNQQIQQQNNKISQRIKNARSKNGLAPKNYQKLKKQSNNYKKVHSRFSQRSQSQMKQILNQLNYDYKKIPFLPVLRPSRYSKY